MKYKAGCYEQHATHRKDMYQSGSGKKIGDAGFYFLKEAIGLISYVLFVTG
ncbi:MAG TPA: hypothetical protein VL098_06400 [Flavipsychrobacter sp.]|nr:hypothetical protein [Flavipsychrobacter sp.]